MGKSMNISDIPQIDSIQELAHFWDTHDLTDFEDELEEVREPVFGREAVVRVQLEREEIEALNQIANPKESALQTWLGNGCWKRFKSRE